jgi:hypothetical protein
MHVARGGQRQRQIVRQGEGGARAEPIAPARRTDRNGQQKQQVVRPGQNMIDAGCDEG